MKIIDKAIDKVYYGLYEVKLFARRQCTEKALWLIQTVNRNKNEGLAEELHEIAGKYQRRPQEGWSPPSDWECWEAEK